MRSGVWLSRSSPAREAEDGTTFSDSEPRGQRGQTGKSILALGEVHQTTANSANSMLYDKQAVGGAMIARIWQGCTRPGMGKAYMPYLAQTGLKEYQESKELRIFLC
jgi:hypothetical protein